MNIRETFEQLMQLERKETEWLEIKEAKKSFDFDDIGKYFSALSNEANLKNREKSWLVFGIKDNQNEIVGTLYRSEENHLHHLKHEIAEHTSNHITFIEIHVLFIDRKRIIMFEIPPAPPGLPIAWKGHYYGRNGNSLSPLNLQEIEEIRSQKQVTDWSALICINATINDLDTEAITLARDRYLKKHPEMSETIKGWTDEVFLNKIRVTINGFITHSAIILLGKPESEIFLKPSISQISWILKDHNNIMLDYEHFYPPLLLNTTRIFNKIRNTKYRYITDRSLFPEELDKYDTYVIREALNNCIAHQNYVLSGKINVIEKPDELIFENVGNFFIQMSIEDLLEMDTAPEVYRNPFLARAMVELGMIDSVGSGISRMFLQQRKRFFPLPDYDFSDPEKVKVKIFGKVLDPNYTKLLISKTDLSLKTIALLDKVQKKKIITEFELKHLRSLKLIEGRKPNLFISGTVANLIDHKATYIRNRGFDKNHYVKMIIEYLKKYKSASREEIDKLIFDKLPDILEDNQKKTRIKNLLYYMAKEKMIYCEKRGPKVLWYLINNG